MNKRRPKIEFGDFQTPLPLAEAVCALLKSAGYRPRVLIEPTCGEGSFLEAGIRAFGADTAYFGLDINSDYVVCATRRLQDCHPKVTAPIFHQDFFTFDWKAFLSDKDAPLLLGNLPWVTNAVQGILGSENLPEKTNLKRLSGLDAMTGKSNFDISEWMLLKLIESAGKRPFTIAMLCKTAVARKILEYCWKKDSVPIEGSLYGINALEWFGASVSACLFVARFNLNAITETTAPFYETLNSQYPAMRFGFVDGEMVSNIDEYQQVKRLQGVNYYRWRSGIKHDLAKVMELDVIGEKFVNGFGAEVDIEEENLYPLLKSSDIAKGVITPSRYALVTQKSVGEDTEALRKTSPKTWDYLEQHSALFSARKSSIYQKHSLYSLFGIGAYTFAPFKVAISGLYKQMRFTLVPPYCGKPVLMDDTCYFIGCDNLLEAETLHELFSAEVTHKFLHSVVFTDSKRPITADILNRLDVHKIAEQIGASERLSNFLKTGTMETEGQGVMVFEKRGEYAPSS